MTTPQVQRALLVVRCLLKAMTAPTMLGILRMFGRMRAPRYITPVMTRVAIIPAINALRAFGTCTRTRSHEAINVLLFMGGSGAGKRYVQPLTKRAAVGFTLRSR